VINLEAGLVIGKAAGGKTTFHHYAPLFPTKRENRQLKKDKKSENQGIFPELDNLA
jgi:hypothetical protein